VTRTLSILALLAAIVALPFLLRKHDAATAWHEGDPTLVDAWINRAAVRFAKRNYSGALDDLTQALSIREDAKTRYNRGRVKRADGVSSRHISTLRL